VIAQQLLSSLERLLGSLESSGGVSYGWTTSLMSFELPWVTCGYQRVRIVFTNMRTYR